MSYYKIRKMSKLKGLKSKEWFSQVLVRVISKVKVFKNKSNSKFQKCFSSMIGLITKNSHEKYQNSNAYCLTVLNKVNVYKK